MSSSSSLANDVLATRRPNRRLWLVLLACVTALILATLPVLTSNPASLIFGAFCGIRQAIGSLFDRLTGKPEQSTLLNTMLPTKTNSRSLQLEAATVEQLNKEIVKYPKNASLHNQVGIIYAQMGEFPSAISHLENAVEICQEQCKLLSATHPPNTLRLSQLNVELSAAHSNLARLYDRLGEHEKVIAELDKLNNEIVFPERFAKESSTYLAGDKRDSEKLSFQKDIFPDSRARLSPLTAAVLAKAQALMQSKRISEANAHNNLGVSYLAKGENSKAKNEFNQALALDPKQLNATVNLSNLLAADGEYDRAIKLLKTLVLCYPASATAHNNLGSVLSLAGQSQQAIAEFHSALSLEPNMSNAYYGLGVALLNLQSYQDAARAFNRALELNPNLVDAYNKLEMVQRAQQYANHTASSFSS